MSNYRTEHQMLSGTLLKDGPYESIKQMLERIADMIPSNQILCELDKDKNMVYYTARDLYDEVCSYGDGLIDAGLKGEHIAIVADNCCRYLITDMTVSCGVGVVTPIDVEAPLSLLSLLLQKCDATAVVCSSRCVETLRQVQEDYPALKTIITIDKPLPGCLFYDDLVAKGASLGAKASFRRAQVDLDAPAKILFTSGTTGPNKGVVLTQRNLAANMMNCLDTIKVWKGRNIDLSVLPMHHAIEINTHIMARIGSGHLTCINGDMRKMMTNVKVFQPDTLTLVPMIVNVFYRNIWANAEKAGMADKLRKGIKLNNFLRHFGIDISRKLFSAVYAPFGGHLRMIVCGGSMLNPNIVKGMNDLGIRIENGYGITECGPLISMNPDPADDILSVGKPCPSFEVLLLNPDDEGVGELCVKGPSVSKGYYKDEKASAEVFYPDGFFNTGDSARIDSSGRIILVGRKKNTIILENGKNVCPEEVENAVETGLDYATEAIVYQAVHACGRKCLVAGVFIPDEDIRADRARIEADVNRLNALLPSYKRIDYVELVEAPLPRTASKKLIRTALPANCSGKGIEIA